MAEKKDECAEEVPDLLVHEGDRVTLSYSVDRFKPNYKILYPRNIDEVKQAMGVPKEVPLSRPLCCDSPLKTSISNIAQLEDPQVSKAAIKNIRLAAREYVQGDYKNVENRTGVINKWLGKVNAIVRTAVFNDIVVGNGGVLHVSKDTHVLSAKSIKLYGTGHIETEGDLTIDCTSLEGYLGAISAVSRFEAASAVTTAASLER